ncbi:MAG: hypothetical protein KatS3mg115_0875 [Candidatus Poribacteria bacterium]|nr:MAG: hypothetical protein KatS3mg115_0875 [Candidatus Poribacteria bacterium]
MVRRPGTLSLSLLMLLVGSLTVGLSQHAYCRVAPLDSCADACQVDIGCRDGYDLQTTNPAPPLGNGGVAVAWLGSGTPPRVEPPAPMALAPLPGRSEIVPQLMFSFQLRPRSPPPA